MRFGSKSALPAKSIIKKALEFYIEELKKNKTAAGLWDLKRAEQVLEEMDNKVTRYDMRKFGGRWLGAAREWMQWEFLNGDSVTWGSEDILSQRSNLTPRMVEDFAAIIAAAAVNEDRENG